ncbi:MAG: hypothetical protein ABJC13_04405 [Acidobacteriota bacterium]
MSAITLPEPTEKIFVEAPTSVARELPSNLGDRTEILRLGLREWKILKALEADRKGEGTLAYAAHRAGISLWEIGAVAYSHGLGPDLDPRVLDGEMTLERASLL